jgi:hypothetical protein
VTPINTDGNTEKKHYRESALLVAAHILISLTKGKSNQQIAVDFDNNLEFVSVWIDYMIGAKWMYKDTDGKWITTGDGKRWIEKYYDAM